MTYRSCTPPEVERVVRIDRYTITIDGIRVRATPDQEARIRQLSPEQLTAFRLIMRSEWP